MDSKKHGRKRKFHDNEKEKSPKRQKISKNARKKSKSQAKSYKKRGKGQAQQFEHAMDRLTNEQHLQPQGSFF